jgi:hypothetical protein
MKEGITASCLLRDCDFYLVKKKLVYADSLIKEVINHLHEVRSFGASRGK